MSEEQLSETSSSSSYVPVEQVHVEDAVQVIDESKHFNPDILSYISKACPPNVGHNYHIVAVFGSQSTGKSTLLNSLFNTNFDVMNEQSRQQTTKGIWLAQSPALSTSSGQAANEASIIVMDVEGTDGRERGEDQDFERKAALFALSTSEVLILNIWETQIGLYQGANMGLLKTVFEVNITLFGTSKLDSSNEHKVLLLVVIRDHVGNTPVENLAKTVKSDLTKMWDSLSKPSELGHLTFDDFFDLDFHTLNHKILQPEQFSKGVAKLGDRLFRENEIFKPKYHHNIPIDGWTMYAENCWEQIENNKDLDLPTQQILVAQFKCDEIVDTVFNEFLSKYNELFKKLEVSPVYADIGALFKDVKSDVFEEYDHLASRYNQSVYQQKRLKLDGLLNAKLKEVFDLYAKQLISTSTASFKKDLAALKGKNFAEQSKKMALAISELVELNLGLISLEGAFEIKELVSGFNREISTAVTKQQKLELDNIVSKSVKKLTSTLTKTMQLELNDPNEKTWDNIYSNFRQLLSDFNSKYDGDFGLNTTKEENEFATNKFQFQAWVSFYDVIRKLIFKEKIVEQLQTRFDDKFRYDENGLPKLYQNARELEDSFAAAKTFALNVLPILTIAKLSDDSEIIPDFDIFDKKLRNRYLGTKKATEVEEEEEDDNDNDDDDDDDDGDDDDDETNMGNFADIINETEKSQILSKFKKEIDAKFVETKRAIIQHITQIPFYIYLIIIFLGWNEFMAVVRNPFTFSLAIILGASLYILYSMNLLKPALIVGQRLVDEVIVVGKEKLREVLVDDYQRREEVAAIKDEE
ncbi:uncharacterized protein LODBEIA_P12510 [Lodderomyces beijingensis]|uniref:GB1/RHD3-type G domain-containing protein n=1 Tax=Lodderomyces beijingensis TaxID=1775926 RepID=A0ABP0ZHV6_9ASCO